jgi:transposase
MMGRQTADQGALFYEFRLEDRVPEGHLLRRINAVIAPVFTGLHQQLAPYYSSTGRPSIDPELMIKMLIIGYCHVSARSAGCARRWRSISPIVGSAALT